MKINAPTKNVFWISAVLAVLGLAGLLGVTALAAYAPWLLVAGYVLLFLGNTLKGF